MKSKIHFPLELLASFMITAMIIGSSAPLLYYIRTTPPGKTFVLMHNQIQDYYSYLHYMRQGYDGEWLLTTRYTPEQFPRQLNQTYFIFLGKVAKLFDGNMPFTYTLARVTEGIILALLTFILASAVLQKKTKVLCACFLAWFGTSFWWLTKTSHGFVFHRTLDFWTEFDALYRATFLPHHMAALIFFVASILFLTKALTGRFFPWIILASVSGLLCGLTNPATLLLLFTTLGVCVLFYTVRQIVRIGKTTSTALRKRRLSEFLLFSLTVGSFGVVSSLALFHLYRVQHAVFPWSDYKYHLGFLNFSLSFKDYLLGMGPSFVLALLALPLVVKTLFFGQNASGEKPSTEQFVLLLLILSWAIAPFIGIFIIAPMGIVPNSYFFQGAHYIPLSILGAISLTSILQKLRRIHLLLPVVAIAILFLYFAVSWHETYRRETSYYSPNIFNIFIDKEIIDAMKWLDTNSPYESVVLAGPYTSVFLPGFTHNRVHSGHAGLTYKYGTKQTESDLFFRQDDSVGSQKILAKYPISYVFYTYDTPAAKEEFIKQLGGKRVYHNPAVTIFAFANSR